MEAVFGDFFFFLALVVVMGTVIVILAMDRLFQYYDCYGYRSFSNMIGAAGIIPRTVGVYLR